MSQEQHKAFLEKVKGDTSLQEKLKCAADDDSVVEIARASGFLISAEDLKTMTTELSDEELVDEIGGLAETQTPYTNLSPLPHPNSILLQSCQ